MMALRGSRLFDGLNDRLVRHPVVIINDDKIIAVLERGDPPADIPVFDLGDVTFLPGLIDAHVHLVLPGVPNPVAAAAVPDKQLLANARCAAAASLDVGITTARDLGDRHYVTLRVRAETAQQPHLGPHLLASGPPITTPNGHCWFLGGAAKGLAQLAKAVRVREGHHVDLVKIMASGGEITPGSNAWQPQYTEEEIRTVVTESHRLGLPVAAHAHAVDAIERALAAGVNTIEHATFRTSKGIKSDPLLMERMAASGLPVSVTTGFSPTGPPLDEKAKFRIQQTLKAAVDMRDAGVRIVCASDAGISDQKPHGLLPWSIIRLVEAGFSSEDSLRAATSTAADACGLKLKGRIAPGFDADLIAVAGDPFREIGVILAVRVVYRGGQLVRSFGPDHFLYPPGSR
jgi:imidazolonepropionase-like amidohydrolase